MSENLFTRRRAIGGVGTLIAGAALAEGQVAGPGQGTKANPQASGDWPVGLAPLPELAVVPEFEALAKLRLSDPVFSTIAGGDRRAFDRITFRPRLLVPTLDLDLSLELFGDTLFAPILVGPVSEQRQFHPEGEIATVRGASAAKAVMVVSSHSSYPIDEIAAQADTALWYQVYADGNVTDVTSEVRRAVEAGCKAVCMTVGASYRLGKRIGDPGSRLPASANPQTDWRVVDQICQAITVPVLLKGIMTPEDARTAVQHGAQGLVVSNFGGLLGPDKTAPIEVLPSIVDAVAGQVPVLVDGSFRWGSDILKALAFGATGVLLSRPAMWGLAAYGAEGVQTVVELLQSELARSMAMNGRPNLKALDRSVLRIHAR